MSGPDPWHECRPELLNELRGLVGDKYPALTLSVGHDVRVGGLLDVTGDFFQIEIHFPEDYPERLPVVYETGGEKERLSKKRGLPVGDLHYNPDDGSACLCVEYDKRWLIRADKVFESFMDELVVPFFYSQAVFAKEGQWPFGERAHGLWGVIQFYQEQLGTTDVQVLVASLRRLSRHEKPKGHRLCVCGSGRPMSACHPGVLAGLAKLRRIVTRTEAARDLELLMAAARQAADSNEASAQRPLVPWSAHFK